MKAYCLTLAVACGVATSMPAFMKYTVQRADTDVEGDRPHHKSSHKKSSPDVGGNADTTDHMDLAPGAGSRPGTERQMKLAPAVNGNRETEHQVTLKPGSCIGFDLCVPATTKTAHRKEMMSAPSEEEPVFPTHVPARKGCSANHDALDKTMLLPVVPYFHGITALEVALMSSKNVATLCKAGTWQCEARFHDPNKAIRDNLLQTYGKYWDMDRHLLLEKGPRGNFSKVHREFLQLRGENTSSPLMHNALQKNVHLRLAYVIMWRPVCLAPLSQHGADASADRESFAIDELLWLEDLMIAHMWLSSQGLHPLVVNLGDLFWKQQHTKRRLQAFLPCMGNISMHFKPKMNEDVFPGNHWQADASIAEFAAAVDPVDCCGYDVQTAECSGEHDFFNALPGFKLKARAHKVLQYLKQHS